ncbi:dimethylarginine dimethylaminohydrolase family protein [Acidisoma cladoniae]|jgi:arginine deiminase|uniref:dimethylarginine dimethylaminohydrolase family protein n=1 Tax=Acidisoma cladoniae TaxID=3040935 RepID=UPI0025516367|nr:arginine deiminase family protein [Acidisoma sp. PAMC 29798]
MHIALDTTKDARPSLVSNEYSRLIEVALCKPTHYDWAAENAIVAASKAAGASADRAAAEVQHAGMVQALEQAGVAIHYLEADPYLPMQTFARDSAVMTPWGLLVCQMARRERRGEWVAGERLAATLDLPIWQRVTAAPVEGGDIQVMRPGEILVGVNEVRTYRKGAEQVAHWVAEMGWTAKLMRVPAHFLHLDVLFTALTDKLALCATDILEAEDVAWLRERFELISVGYSDVMRMGCNVTALGDGRVLSAAQNGTLNAKMRAHGLDVMAPDLEQFVLEGGSTHCLTMPLRRAA